MESPETLEEFERAAIDESRPRLQRLSNRAFVNAIMDESERGVMAELFVIEAINHYSSLIAVGERPAPNPRELFSRSIWWDIGQDIRKALEERMTALPEIEEETLVVETPDSLILRPGDA